MCSLIAVTGIEASAAMVSPKRQPLSVTRDLREKAVRRTGGPKHGAKPTEVYGFVGAISTLVGFAVFLTWAYLPEPWLHSMGITYYPNRYWAMAIPAYVLVTIVFVVSFYASVNHLATPAPCSLDTLFDEFTRGPSSSSSLLPQAEQPIHAICDVPITTVNSLMFGSPVEN